MEMAGLLVIKEMTEIPEEMVLREEMESPVPRVRLVRTVRKAHR